jgi:hypothetical protein
VRSPRMLFSRRPHVLSKRPVSDIEMGEVQSSVLPFRDGIGGSPYSERDLPCLYCCRRHHPVDLSLKPGVLQSRRDRQHVPRRARNARMKSLARFSPKPGMKLTASRAT